MKEETLTNKMDPQEEILLKIRNGWIVAVIVAVINLGITFYGMRNNLSIESIDPYAFGLIGLILALAIGIYLKSRVASTLMLVTYIASLALTWLQEGLPKGFIFALIFIYFFYQAMVATFQYHKRKKVVG